MKKIDLCNTHSSVVPAENQYSGDTLEGLSQEELIQRATQIRKELDALADKMVELYGGIIAPRYPGEFPELDVYDELAFELADINDRITLNNPSTTEKERECIRLTLKMRASGIDTGDYYKAKANVEITNISADAQEEAYAKAAKVMERKIARFQKTVISHCIRAPRVCARARSYRSHKKTTATDGGSDSEGDSSGDPDLPARRYPYHLIYPKTKSISFSLSVVSPRLLAHGRRAEAGA